MLNIKNNDIRFRRGDTTVISLDITDVNGIPYILPVFPNDKYLDIVNVGYTIANNYLYLYLRFNINMPVNAVINAEWNLDVQPQYKNQSEIRIMLPIISNKLEPNWRLIVDNQAYTIINGFEWTINSGDVSILLNENYNKLLIGQKVYNAYIGMSIRDGVEGNIVYENFLDMNNSPAWYTTMIQENGKDKILTDVLGFTKYESQTIEEVALSYLPTYLMNNQYKVAKSEGKYFCAASIDVTKPSDPTKLLVCNYEFKIAFQINAEDTLKLDLQNYIYDICLFIGEQDFEELDKLPLKNIAYKQTLVPASTIVVEDNING